MLQFKKVKNIMWGSPSATPNQNKTNESLYLAELKTLMPNFSKADERKQAMADNTYLLALDGDIDFQPSAVTRLVDLMKKNKNLGAACGRILPTG